MKPFKNNPLKNGYGFSIPALGALALLSASCRGGKETVRHNKNYMERTYTSMKVALPNAKVVLQSDTVKVIFSNAVLFDFNKAEVSPKMFPSFEQFARVLNEYRKTEVLIVGHSDTIGGDNVNNQLSTRRADSAGRVLQYYKVAASRIEKWGMGAREPIASNATEEGRAQNRRVEFIILYDYHRQKVAAKKQSARMH